MPLAWLMRGPHPPETEIELFNIEHPRAAVYANNSNFAENEGANNMRGAKVSNMGMRFGAIYQGRCARSWSPTGRYLLLLQEGAGHPYQQP